MRDPLEHAKGISKSVNKLVLKHDMYKNCLMDVELRNDRVQRIGSNAHQLYTYDTNKGITLSF